MRYASDADNDQFEQAEARGFNPYAPPGPRRFWGLTEPERGQFMREAAAQEGAARFEDLPPEVRCRYYEATWTSSGGRKP